MLLSQRELIYHLLIITWTHGSCKLGVVDATDTMAVLEDS